MFWSLVLNLVLIFFVIHLCSSAFKFVKVSLFHHVFIPVYSLIMLAITMRWTQNDLIYLAVLVAAAAFLGWIETLDLHFIKTKSKKGRPVYKMRRGWPYVLGWSLVILIGLILSDLADRDGLYHLFADRMFETLWEEIDPLSLFTQSHPWYIWALSGVSSTVFAWLGSRKLKADQKKGNIPEV